MNYPCAFRFLAGLLMLLLSLSAFAQPELQAWGNLRGIRVGGQLFQLESSLRVLDHSWQAVRRTAKERNWSRYYRQGRLQRVETRMDSLFFVQEVYDTGRGTARVDLTFDPGSDTSFTAAFFHLQLPAAEYADARITPLEIEPLTPGGHPLPPHPQEVLRLHARGMEFTGSQRQLRISSDAPVEFILVQAPHLPALELYVRLQATAHGQASHHSFELTLSGTIDTSPAHLQLYPQYAGNPFLGLGGNFRLQNPRTDPQVIDYCLQNMEVRMGRVELPWQYWHAQEDSNPLEAARRGELHARVKAAMEMAQRLYQMGMPVLVAVWFPPAWAVEGIPRRNPRNPDGTFGNLLRQDKMEQIYESLTAYLLYLREAYGVEVSLFSFNESDLGINVRQTPAQHAALIKGLGARLRARGLRTNMLLGDTADANGYGFVEAALDDPATWQYIGAVSFHSWRGWEKATLIEWFEAADRIDVPLIVGEGSIDAAAWRYPQIFETAHYALEEIRLYVRILAICQPQSILQWQLTADYSPLAGGGIFGNDSTPLHPTQRFWNLRQLAHTPAQLRALPLSCDKAPLAVAALGDPTGKRLAIHLVNDGPSREVVIRGLPKKVKSLRLYLTNAQKGMEKGRKIRVRRGELRFEAEAVSFISLMSE